MKCWNASSKTTPPHNREHARQDALEVDLEIRPCLDASSSRYIHRSRVLRHKCRAALVGDDTCSARGLMARGTSPVLGLCRALIAAGANPSSQDGRSIVTARSRSCVRRIGQGSQPHRQNGWQRCSDLVLDGVVARCQGPPVAPAAQPVLERHGRGVLRWRRHDRPRLQEANVGRYAAILTSDCETLRTDPGLRAELAELFADEIDDAVHQAIYEIRLSDE